jgi:hypothetical protein
MKKLFIFLAAAIIAVMMPLTLTGCDSNKSPSEIANAYSAIQSNNPDYFDATTRVFSVNFTSSAIKNNMNNSGSQIYSLGKVYMPLLEAGMSFVNSKATTFKACLDKFSKDELAHVYTTMKKFGEDLKAFDLVKKTFDSEGKTDGTRYPALVGSMNNLIDSAIAFNLAFYEAYYNNIYAKETNYTEAGFKFTSEDMKTEVLGNKLCMAYVLNNNYAKHYHWSNTYSINTFLTSQDCAYMNTTIAILTNKSTPVYNDTDKNAMIALRQNHESFMLDMYRAIENMAKFDYNKYLNSTAKEKYMESLSTAKLDQYTAVENFMESRFMPIYYATQGLLA